MIRSLLSLRGIFAVVIFLSHYKIGPTALMPSGGDCGVAFFIMLSGFVLSAGYADRFRRRETGYRKFIVGRVRKLYPLHLMCFVWAVFLYHYLSPVTAVPNLLLLQSWVPSPSFFFSYNAVSWYLSDALFFYLAFSLLIKAGVGRSVKAAAVCLTATLGYVGFSHLIRPDLLTAIAYVNPLVRLIDFGIGMLLWQLFDSRRFEAFRTVMTDRLSFASKSAIELVVVAWLALTVYFYPSVDECYGLASYWWPVMGVMILQFSAFDRDGGVVSRLLHSRILLSLGSVSFAFYMVHVLTISSVDMVVLHSGIAIPEIVRFIVVFVIAVVLATMYHRLLDPKLVKLYGK